MLAAALPAIVGVRGATGQDDSFSLMCDGRPAPELPTIFNPAGPVAAELETVTWLLVGICAAIFVVVQGALIHAIRTSLRARREALAAGGGDAAGEPPQVYGSNPVELAWTVIPVIIVFLLALTSIRLIRDIELTEPPEGALRIQVIAHQWWWEYRYPEEGIVTANELVVPVDRPVWLELHSADVIHSWWVPQLAGKTDCIPGHPNALWFKATRTGVFLGQCAEYCGNQHANMLLRVEVRDETGYDAWVRSQQAPAVDDPQTRPGRDLFLALACQRCHDIAGISTGSFGPNLTHFMSRTTLGAGVAPLNRETLRSWIADPQVLKPGANMPSLKLDEAQLDAVVAYLLTLQ